MKNYKSTLIGVIGSIWIAIQPFLTTQGFDISKDWKSLVGAAFVAGFGFVVKDFNVTGGTVPNTPNDADVVKETTKVDSPK